MTNSINPDSIGLFNHAGLTITNDVEKYTQVKYTPNRTETLGSAILWSFVQLPCHIKNVATQPQIVVVALTAIALLSTVFIFHNSSTTELAKLALKTTINHLTQAKVTVEVAMIAGITGWGIRAYGRLTNSDLLKNWHQKKPESTSNE